MSPRNRLYLLLPVLLSLLACQAVTQPLERLLNPAPTTTTESYTPRPTIPPLPSITPTATAVSESLNTPTSQATHAPTVTQTETPIPQDPSPTPLSQELQLGIFQELWDIVNDEYLYADFNGLDWNAIHEEYHLGIEGGLTNPEFYLAMDEMISRLGDDHSVYLSPEAAVEEDAEYEGNLDYVGIGVLISAVPERSRAAILVVFPGSPAEEAGLQPRDTILSVDGTPILDEGGFLRDIVRGPEGTVIDILVQTPGEEPRSLTITRRRISGALPVPYTVLTTASGKRIGYIFLVGFSDSTVDEQVGDALRALSAKAPLDGLIIDNRENSGGADTILRPTLSYFTSGTLGYFISRSEERPLEVKQLEDINGSGELPLVILVGINTVSYGEIFSGVLQDVGRAYLIGETTEGNVETLWGYDFEDGSRAWIAHESFRPLNNPGQAWEQTGIIPDLTVIADFDQYTQQDDPAVLAALAYLESP